ncbi:MAG: HD domain-containing protein [Saprospiraceae bacterium]|nr:HD domain-containing protein [Saprospiraceae bacterium]
MNILETNIISNAIAFVKNAHADAEAGHDWLHIERVLHNALKIGEKENVDMTVVILAVLLHDIADAKFHDGDETIGPRKTKAYLESQNIETQTIDHVVAIVENMSYRKSLGKLSFQSRELEVVQDADRLDAIGAIGIARAFSYGGFKGRPFYDEDHVALSNMTQEQYQKSQAATINHFYEKLLLLKDKMNTETGRAMAQNRHNFMLMYLEQFYEESGIQPLG